MDINLVNDVLQNFAAQLVTFIRILQPVGEAVAGSLTVLAIVMLGANMVVGGPFVAPLVRFTGAAAGTFWAVRTWDTITLGAVDASHRILSMFIPGYAGPATLFEAASAATNRLVAEPAAWGWSLSGTLGALTQQVLIAICGVLVAIGLSFPGLLSILSELNLMLGAAVAPLILPALAFPLTAPLGWGCVTFMIAASLRIVTLGAISWLFASAIQAQLDLPGADATMTLSGTLGLLLTASFAVLVAVAGNGISNQLVGSGLGSLGVGSIQTAGAVVQGSVGAASSAAMSGAGAAAKAAGAPAGRAAGSVAHAAGKVTSVGSGSAFP